MHSHCRKYFSTGSWGKRFIQWMASNDPQPYANWGNGSAMRIAPVGWIANTAEDVITLSDKYTLITHNHPEAIDAPEPLQCRPCSLDKNKSPDEMRQLLSDYYPLDYSINDIRETYQRTERAKDSVPQAISVSLELTSFTTYFQLMPRRPPKYHELTETKFEHHLAELQ